VGHEARLERGELVGRQVPDRLRGKPLDVDAVQHALDHRIVRPVVHQGSRERPGALRILGPDGDDDPSRTVLELALVARLQLALAVPPRRAAEA
jgi:hypothetical protein